MNHIHEIYSELEELITYGEYEVVLAKFNLLEKALNAFNIDFLNIKLLKIKFFNYIANYREAIDIINDIFAIKEDFINDYFFFNFIIEKLKSFEALNKIKECFSLIEKGNMYLSLFKEKNDRKSQISVANYLLIIGVIYQKDYQYDQALEYLNKSLRIYTQFNESLGIAEVLYKKGLVYYLNKEFTTSLKQLNESIEISKKYNPNMYMAWGLTYKAMAFYYQRNYDEIPSVIVQSLKISKKFHNIHCEDFCMVILAHYYNNKGDFDKALKYNKESLKLRRIRGNPIEIAYVLADISQIYSRRGNLEKCEYYLNQAIKYPEAAEDPLSASLLLTTKGILLSEQAKYSLAADHLKQAIILFEKSNSFALTMKCYHYLISIELLKNNKEQAYQYLEEIHQYSNLKLDNQHIHNYWLLEKAIIYKNSRDTYKELLGKKILEDIISADIPYPDLKIEVIIHYLEIIISELKFKANKKAFHVIDTILNKLEKYAKIQKKYTLISEIFLFKANLEINNSRYTKAMEFYTKALKYAKKINLELLIIKISKEYDTLLDYFYHFSNSQQVKIKFNENIKIYDFQFLFSKMTRNLQFNFLDSPEVPIFLIIWSEIGSNLYEIIFNERNSGFNKEEEENLFREHKNSLKEQFISNPKIDRLKQDQITIVENRIKTIRFDYGFQGHSYHASRKLDLMVQNLKKDDKLCHFFNENINYNVSKEMKEYLNKEVKKVFSN